MDCYYINLDTQTERRAKVEENFKRFIPADWRLHRFPALTGEASQSWKIRGGAAGCYRSHLELLRSNKNAEAPFLICEDDVLFGEASGRLLSHFVNKTGRDWDVLFPEIGIANPQIMIQLLLLRRQLMSDYKAQLIDLATYPFFSSTCYIVNNSKLSVFTDLVEASLGEAPYAMVLRKIIMARQVRAKFIFPFATPISEFALDSQIQQKDTQIADFVWNEFRKLMYIDRDMNSLNKHLTAIVDDVSDPETLHFSKILAVRLSTKFRSK